MKLQRFTSGLLIASACILPSCSKETGKYQAGENDAALKVKDKDIAQVNKTLDKQAEADRAKGLRKNPPPLPAFMRTETNMNLPAGHPPIGENAPLLPPKPPGAASMQSIPEGPITIGALKAELPAG